MISLQINHQVVDINDSASVRIGGSSPFTQPGEISGPKIYNLSALKTSRNQRIFGFAERLNNMAREKEFEGALIKFYNLLWKQGTLKLRDFSGHYNFSFHTDAGDIGLKAKNKKLSELDLGTAPNDGNVADPYPLNNHVFFTVNSPAFYGEENKFNPDYLGQINALNGTALATNGGSNQYNIVPFPYLLHIMDRVFKEMGYRGMEGDWTQQDEIRRVVIWNNYDLAKMEGATNVYDDTIIYSNHVPDISVGAFLIDVAIYFGITYKVNPITKMVKVVRIKDWLLNPDYVSFNGKASGGYKLEPNGNDGFRFVMKADSDDGAFEREPLWLSYQHGGGQDEIPTEASTLEIDETDMPYTLQQGSGPAFELDPRSRAGLRFMLFTGSHAAPGTGHYQQPGFSLRWDGPDGIIARSYTEWLEWKSYTEYTEREVELNAVELLQLDLERKIMIDNLKWVIADFEGSISNDKKRRPVKLKLYSIRR